MVENSNNEKHMVWMHVKKWTDTQKQMQVNALESEVELLKLEEIKGDSIETTKSEINKELMKTEKVLNQVIELSLALK